VGTDLFHALDGAGGLLPEQRTTSNAPQPMTLPAWKTLVPMRVRRARRWRKPAACLGGCQGQKFGGGEVSGDRQAGEERAGAGAGLGTMWVAGGVDALEVDVGGDGTVEGEEGRRDGRAWGRGEGPGGASASRRRAGGARGPGQIWAVAEGGGGGDGGRAGAVDDARGRLRDVVGGNTGP
jgi:hypothetical protein